MVSGIQAIALLAPVAASNAVFSVRRASRGVDSISDNPFYGAMNLDIAAGQSLKGARAAKDIATAADSEAKLLTNGASFYIKKLAENNKIVKYAGKIINFTADNINPVICLTSGVKVLGSDDKVDATARESIALGTMFGAEAVTKRVLGMPYVEKDINGNRISKSREALYKKNPFVEKQVAALKDFCATKRALKYAPAALKGLLFVGASIAGYQLGTEAANCILGEQKQSAA